MLIHILGSPCLKGKLMFAKTCFVIFLQFSGWTRKHSYQVCNIERKPALFSVHRNFGNSGGQFSSEAVIQLCTGILCRLYYFGLILPFTFCFQSLASQLEALPLCHLVSFLIKYWVVLSFTLDWPVPVSQSVKMTEKVSGWWTGSVPTDQEPGTGFFI